MMPTISMFYGILVMMFFEDNDHHHLPHIHAKCAGDAVVMSLPDGQVLAGSFPRSKLKLLEAWIELHQDELMANWQLALNNEQLYKIEPLR